MGPLHLCAGYCGNMVYKDKTSQMTVINTQTCADSINVRLSPISFPLRSYSDPAARE